MVQPFYSECQKCKKCVYYIQINQKSTTFVSNDVWYPLRLVQIQWDGNLQEAETSRSFLFFFVKS